MNPYLEELQIEDLNRFDFYEAMKESSSYDDENCFDDASFSDGINSGNDF